MPSVDPAFKKENKELAIRKKCIMDRNNIKGF